MGDHSVQWECSGKLTPKRERVGGDVSAVTEIEGWEDKQAEKRREKKTSAGVF